MQHYRKYYPASAALTALIVLWLGLFSVKETEFVLVTQFGRPVRTVADAGLHAKWPFHAKSQFSCEIGASGPDMFSSRRSFLIIG